MRQNIRFLLWLSILVAGVFIARALVHGQTLSDQVLQLLTRANTWTGTQSFQDLRVPLAAVPADTSARIYTDLAGNLYFNGGLIAGAGGGVTPHNLLSTTHADTVAAAALRGAILVGNATPAWNRLAIGASGTVLRSDGTDAGWSTVGSGLTALNASELGSGTVPLARLANIANAQIDAAAAIAWTKLSKTGSSLADLTTRSAADLSSGTLADARLSANVSLFGGAIDNSEISNGTITFSKWASNSCSSNQVPQWNGSAWACATITPGSGTVTSVALSLPGVFSVTGSPIIASGTLTGTLATQVMNTLWAGPTAGADAQPTFRALVNADLPLSGAVAATYPKVTVNTRGVVTAGVAQITLTTDVTGVLPMANGGTGLNAAADDTTMIGSGAAWVAQTLPNCVAGALGYATATNLWSCVANAATTDSTQTFTNKTFNAESTGNILTTVEKHLLQGGRCQNVTAVTDWSTPATNPAVAACQTGANTTFGTLDFADGANLLSAQEILKLPGDWTGTVNANIVWFTSATAGAVKWQLATACAAVTETSDPTFNAADTVTQTAQGTTNRLNEATISAVTMTGCAAGETLFLRFFRDPTDGADTLAATARLVSLELTTRRAQ